MDLIEIQRVVTQGESHTVEFKKSTAQLKRACETACAFLNTDGGTILIGVTDKQMLVGQEVSDKTKREIGNEIAKITPVANIEIHYVSLPHTQNKQLIIFHVTTDSTQKPYMYDGRAFLRSQSDTIPMPQEHLKQLTLMNAEGNHSWENQTLSNLTLDNLDTEEILATIREGSINGRIPESYSTSDPWTALQRLGLIENNKITNAAMVLFGKEVEAKYPQCLLRLARFKGINKSEFIDNKQVSGNIFRLLNIAMGFVNTYLPIASTFPKGAVQRQDTPLFPIAALREAIANALCHRDYSYYGGSISVAIFDDRLEIWNYGLLPPGIAIEDLKQLNCSIPRNRKIANVLYYHKIFESWGRGIQMIMAECKKAGHPEPFYSQDPVGTLLTLPSKQSIGNSQTMSFTEIPFEALSERQQEIVTLLKKHKMLSPNKLRSLMKDPPPTRTFRDEINRLKQWKFIESTGQTRARKWFALP